MKTRIRYLESPAPLSSLKWAIHHQTDVLASGEITLPKDVYGPSDLDYLVSIAEAQARLSRRLLVSGPNSPTRGHTLYVHVS